MTEAIITPETTIPTSKIVASDLVTIQALLGEALDHLMRARGKHPFGER